MGASIAKFCGLAQQHFAPPCPETRVMRRKKSINVVLAEALKHYMGDHWTPYSLAKKSGVAEGTIRNYLAPEKRQPSASGKEPSARCIAKF